MSLQTTFIYQYPKKEKTGAVLRNTVTKGARSDILGVWDLNIHTSIYMCVCVYIYIIDNKKGPTI